MRTTSCEHCSCGTCARPAECLLQERRSERERELEETTQTVKSAFMLSNQTTSLMAVLTEDADICEQLMRDELVDRLAAMLMNALTSLGTLSNWWPPP